MIHLTQRVAGFAATAAAASLLSISGAQAQTAFAKALPADTMMFVSMPDIDTSLEELKNAPLGRMWLEEEVQDFFAEAIQMVESQLTEELGQAKEAFDAGQFPFDPNKLTKLRLHSLNFAITDLGLNRVEGRPEPDVGILIHADLGDSAKIWREALTLGMNMISQQSRGQAVFSRRKIGEDVSVLTLAPSENQIPMALEIAFFGDAMAACTKPGRLDSFIGQLGKEALLTKTDLYSSCVKHYELDGAELETFIKPGAFLDFGMSILAIAVEEERDLRGLDLDGVRRAIDALGLNSLHSIGGVSRYDGTRCITEGFTACPAQARKGMTSVASGVIDLAPLRWVPKDASSFSIQSMDLGAFYDSLVQAVMAYDQDTADQLLSQLAKIEEQVGVSVQNDIFGAFGKRVVSWSLPMASFTSPPEAATIIEVKNQEGLINALKKLAQMSNGMIEIEENERRGIRVYQLNVNFDEFGGNAGFNPLAAFTPTFAFKDGNMVVSFSSGDIKRAFKRMDREDDPAGDIRTSGEFKPYLAQLPASGLQSLSFTDWKATFESYYQIGTTVLAFVPLDSDIPIDLSLLPDASTLTQHLIGSVSYGQMTDEGFIARSIGPFGAEAVALLIGVGAGAGVLASTFDGRF